MAQSINAHTVKAFIDTEKTLDKLPTPVGNTATEYEKIRHILIGSQHAVTSTIRVLHQLGYADINEWSPLLPSSIPGEVISVLIRSITI